MSKTPPRVGDVWESRTHERKIVTAVETEGHVCVTLDREWRMMDSWIAAGWRPVVFHNLVEIQKTWAQAHPAPWKWVTGPEDWQRDELCSEEDTILRLANSGEHIWVGVDDMEAIQAAPGHVQYLLAEVYRLRKAIGDSLEDRPNPELEAALKEGF
jgi:hypothetical protein